MSYRVLYIECINLGATAWARSLSTRGKQLESRIFIDTYLHKAIEPHLAGRTSKDRSGNTVNNHMAGTRCNRVYYMLLTIINKLN